MGRLSKGGGVGVPLAADCAEAPHTEQSRTPDMAGQCAFQPTSRYGGA